MMTKEEFTQIRESLSLTKKEMAEKIGVKPMLLGRYESGGCRIPEAVEELVKALVAPKAPAEEEKAALKQDASGDIEDIPAFVKNIRETLNLTKSAFAGMIGVSGSAIGFYENGMRKPKDEILQKIKALQQQAEMAQSAPADASEKEETVSEEIKKEAAPAPEKEPEKAEEANPAAEKKPAEKKKKAAPAKAEAPAATDAPAVYVQSVMGGTITTKEILSRIPADAEKVYVKPEENAAYWVKGDESGSITLW